MPRLAIRVFATRLFATLLVLSAVTERAWAQGGGSGSLTGYVFDQTGMPMAGVKVTASSETQIGGAKDAYTDAEGSFRFVGLIPGVFEIKASVPRMKTVHQKGIKVGVNAPTEVNLVLEVQTKTEEVKVIERAPVVSTKSAVVKEVFDEEFLDNIPSDFKAGAESVVANSVPGSTPTSARASRGARIRGGATNQSSFQVEGFNMNGQRSTLKGMAAIEVQTAGYGAEYATVPGGVVNMVTKSGSNRFELDLNAYAEDSTLSFFRDNIDPTDRSYFYVFNPNVSGPIVKDKLWYFVNLEARPEYEASEADPLGVAAKTPDYQYFSVRGSTKLTWQMSARNKLASFTNFNIRSNWNINRGYSPVTEAEAQRRQDDRDFFTGLIYESLLTDKLFLKSQIGVQRFMQNADPQMCKTEPDRCDHVVPVIQTFPRTINSANAQSRTQTITKKLQFANTLQYFANTKHFGEHDIKLKNDFETQTGSVASSVPGNMILRFNGAVPDRQVEYFSNDPRLEPARYGWFIRSVDNWRNVLSLTDSVRVTRYLTLTPGVALTRAKATNILGDTPFDVTAVTPHFAVAWDATHDNRTVLRGSFNQYVDVDAAAVARFTVGDRVTRTCRWDEPSKTYSRECTFAGGRSGRTIGLPCGPSGFDAQGNPCRKSLTGPRTTESSVGVEREITAGVGLGLDSVYRQYNNQYEVLETNRLWNGSGSSLQPTGGFRNGFNETIQDIETPDGAQRTYWGTTLAVHKREGALKTSASYTLSFLEGTVLDGMSNLYGDIPQRDAYLNGYLADDSRHNLRMTVTYQWTKWLTTGALYDYRSGRPYQREFRNDVTGSYEDYRARVGINPGADLNDPADDRPLRLPDVQLFSLQSRVNWRPLIGINLETYVDVMNALALRTTTRVETDDGPLWGSMTDRLDPFRLRIGARYKW
ncbi:MAG TPA: carboxypeptidase regulatory-like domain-containing protein [Polyangia bacterium]